MKKHLTPEQLIDYVDLKVKGKKKKRIELHLASCTSCQELAERFSTFSASMREGLIEEASIPKVQLSKDLENVLKGDINRILNQGRAKKEKIKWLKAPNWFSIPRLSLAAAASLIIIVCVFFFFARRREEIRVEGEIYRDIPQGLVPRAGKVESVKELRTGERFFFRVSLHKRGYIYILNLDTEGRVYFIFPYLGEKGGKHEYLIGFIDPGEEIRIPIEITESYPLEGAPGSEYFYLVPSTGKIENATLVRTQEEINKDVSRKLAQGNTLEEISRSLLDTLVKKYPGTILKKIAHLGERK